MDQSLKENCKHGINILKWNWKAFVNALLTLHLRHSKIFKYSNSDRQALSTLYALTTGDWTANLGWPCLTACLTHFQPPSAPNSGKHWRTTQVWQLCDINWCDTWMHIVTCVQWPCQPNVQCSQGFHTRCPHIWQQSCIWQLPWNMNKFRRKLKFASKSRPWICKELEGGWTNWKTLEWHSNFFPNHLLGFARNWKEGGQIGSL